MFKRVTSALFLAVCLAAGGTVAFSGAALAADASSNGNPQKAQQLMQQYRENATKLQQIHEKTIKANPSLATEQKNFEQQVRAAVKKQGYDPSKGEKRMEGMAQKLQSGKLSDDQRSATMKQFQDEREKMVTARDAALQQPAIQKAGHKLESDTISAMKKQDSSTPKLISQMQTLRTQLRDAMPAPSKSGNSNS